MSTKIAISGIILIVVLSSVQADIFDVLETYNIAWHSQSSNAAESMPVGGGDTGLNVWVENDELLFYIGQSGTFDENNQMLKHGRVRIKLDPNPFSLNGTFRQELKLEQGFIEIIARTNDKVSAKIKIWVEIYRPVIHVEIDADTKMNVTAQYENWRNAEREIPADDRKSRFPCMSLVGYPGKVTMYPDSVAFDDNAVVWYHRNNNDDLLIDKEIKQQELEKVKDQLYNPLKDRTFGGLIKGDNMIPADVTAGRYAATDFKAWPLKSKSPAKKHKIKIYLNTEQTPTIDKWIDDLKKLAKDADESESSAWQKHQKWWKQFWQRSHVFINTDKGDTSDQPWQAGRNYQIYRYLQACNAYGQWPTKFNGSFFTYDPNFVASSRGVKTETPDYRTWGGGSFTAQNQRLVYWPMIKNGDFDMMPSQFEFYLRSLGNAELRTKVYWGHNGCCFTEQLENFGLPIGSCYGWTGGNSRWGQRDPSVPTGVQANSVTYQFGHQLDFSFMILEYYRYSGKDISRYLPFIESSVTFYDEHYRYRNKIRTGSELDKNGHLVIFPSRAAESYVDANNPAEVIAGLKAVLSRLFELPDNYIPESKKKKYKAVLNTVPPLPIREKDGKPYLAGAKSWEKFQVGEVPELYSVFPFGLYGIGRPNLELPRYTWSDCLIERQKNKNEPWYQGGVMTARLGLTDQAKEINLFKLGSTGQRFPAFKQSDDWAPDHNWLGVGMIGLQEMLMQCVDKKIYLMPAWPKEWNVDFKLHAPYQTIIEGSYINGRFQKLKVTPKNRREDIQIMN